MPCNDSRLTLWMPVKPDSKKRDVEKGRNVTVRFVLSCLMKWLGGMQRLQQ